MEAEVPGACAPDSSGYSAPYSGMASASGGAAMSSLAVGMGGSTSSSSAVPLGRQSPTSGTYFHGSFDLTLCEDFGMSGLLLEQSPAAHSSKAPSDPEAPSEFSSWHDDASSSLATFSGDRSGRTITVNTQRMRMGEHLKGKLQGMIQQRFESYLTIIQVLQNDIGKLAALECELRLPFGKKGYSEPVRVSISCNEDGTFLVYTVHDVAATPVAGSVPGSDNSEDGVGDDTSAPVAASVPSSNSVVGPTSPVAASPSGDETASTGQSPPHSGGEATSSSDHGSTEQRELLRKWVAQVCEFGMSGRCHSLTALFHFGYTAWKQMLGEHRPMSPLAHSWGENRPEQSAAKTRIAEEEEPGQQPAAQPPAGPAKEEVDATDLPAVVPAQEAVEAPASAVAAVLAVATSSCPAAEPSGPPPQVSTNANGLGSGSPQMQQKPPPSSDEGLNEEVGFESSTASTKDVASIFEAAQLAAERGRHREAVDYCTKGILLARGSSGSRTKKSQSSSSSSTAPPATPAAAQDPVILWQLLSLRASMQSRLKKYTVALQDAEELISLQPTVAEGYYWQSVALQGMGHGQEALEALMSALEYEPQNPRFQQAFTSLFEDISQNVVEQPAPHRAAGSRARGSSDGLLRQAPRRSRGGAVAGDALSTVLFLVGIYFG
eukprot:TRINITY_DN35278_c0_g1_i1.p1 TRINITY_DN35278_c0_g1~~TRINITY_DN35278_c0_g1_i1.p1  ORF type:complete len:662 (+),score=165.89 TRINITY_DN35278_c0_g1_i1:64-2049(+)